MLVFFRLAKIALVCTPQHHAVISIERQRVVMHGQHSIGVWLDNLKINVNKVAALGVSTYHNGLCSMCLGQLVNFTGKH